MCISLSKNKGKNWKFLNLFRNRIALPCFWIQKKILWKKKIIGNNSHDHNVRSTQKKKKLQSISNPVGLIYWRQEQLSDWKGKVWAEWKMKARPHIVPQWNYLMLYKWKTYTTKQKKKTQQAHSKHHNQRWKYRFFYKIQNIGHLSVHEMTTLLRTLQSSSVLKLASWEVENKTLKIHI